MATFDDKSIIDNLIDNNGHLDGIMDDPPALRITEYINAWGGTCWGVCYPADNIDRYDIQTDYVRRPLRIFEHEPHADCNHPAGRR